MSEFLPYGRQWVDDDDIAAVTAVLRSDYLTTGPAVATFEDSLVAATGVRNAIAVNSGTSALHAMYFAAGLERGDEVITSPLTFAATANAALYLGADVRFVDVAPDTGNLDSVLVSEALAERTKLVVSVDFAGHPADYDELRAATNGSRAMVVADAAHSLGATYKGRHVGTLAAATEVSFHPVKPVTTAEGGAVLTDDLQLARRAALFRTHGITREGGLMESHEGPWWYEQHHLGYNYRLTDIQAALGTSQMSKLGAFIARRRMIAARYTAAFSDIAEVIVPTERSYVESGWHLYVLRVAGDSSRRRPFFDHLRASGLGVQVHYIPVYYHPYYQQLGFQRGTCPVAEDFYSRAVSLPIYPQMSDGQVDSCIERVLAAVRECL